MSPDDILNRLSSDLELYASQELFIAPKDGGQFIAYRFNRAQKYVHKCLEDQYRLTGKVRAIILKGRQQGMSTYVGARFFHKTAMNHGKNTFIFAHDSDASNSLFNMVRNYYDNLSTPMKPTLGARNHNELNFINLNSGYKVGTAGTSGLGRSKTIQLLHWSEVAYSPNAYDHSAGILQAVPDARDTEVILESTANGEGDFFHTACMQALSGEGDYILIFVPWYWQDEYKRTSESFEPDDEEEKYLELFERDGLTKDHLIWRRYKIKEFQGDKNRFQHEYPFTPEEAFAINDEESYISSNSIRAARNTPVIHTTAPLIFGVDPAALGGDKIKVCHRKGRNITKIETYPKGYPHETARRLARDIDNYKPFRVFIDAGGLGIGVYGCLIDMGYGHIVEKVDFGGRSIDPDQNYNMTAEMFRKAKEWFDDAPVSMTCDEKSAAAIQSQLSSRKYIWHNNSVLRMEKKDEFKKRSKISPDDGDAVLLTFAQEVHNNPMTQRATSVTANTGFNVF